MKFFTTIMFVLAQFINPSPVCNLCDPPVQLFNDNQVAVNATLCNFEIKYELIASPQCGAKLAVDHDKYWDIIDCNATNIGGITQIDIDGNVISEGNTRLDIAEIECMTNANNIITLLFDLYRPILHLKQLNVSFPILLVRLDMPPQVLNLIVP